jgi:hypothetical protein
MYQFRYALSGLPEPRQCGTDILAHDIIAEASSDGETWTPVPGRHRTVLVPSAAVVDALGAGNPASVKAAYRSALADNISTADQPVTGWDQASLSLVMQTRDSELAAREMLSNYLDGLGVGFPVYF